MSVNIEVPFGQQHFTVEWPTTDPVGCARFIREPMIRIDAIWLTTKPMDMRAGTDRMIAVFGAEKPHSDHLFANQRANRMKVLVHDGSGIWLTAWRLNQGKTHCPGIRLELDTEQLQALVLGLLWQRADASGAITLP